MSRFVTLIRAVDGAEIYINAETVRFISPTTEGPQSIIHFDKDQYIVVAGSGLQVAQQLTFPK